MHNNRRPHPPQTHQSPASSIHFNRRSFLACTLKAGALLLAPQVVRGAVLGKDGGIAPSERIVLGAIGIGNRGSYVLGCFMEEPDVQFVAICDVKAARRKAVKERADAKYGNNNCATYRDLRELLARDDLDAVLIATGPNWHALASVTAANAGKDVYCEKPCSMTIQESRALADTYRRYSRIYQAGTQRRSIGNFIFAANLVASGKLGKLKTVHANTLPPATVHTWLPAEPEPPADEVDWDRWLGPCPWRPFNRQYVAGGWRGFFDFHGGGILEWGAHTLNEFIEIQSVEQGIKSIAKFVESICSR